MGRHKPFKIGTTVLYIAYLISAKSPNRTFSRKTIKN